jgi:hypothetical protein
MARPQRTSFSSTNDHPAPFVKRPALAPMCTALGLTSLDLVISNRKLGWAGHVRRMDWSRLPRKFLTSWVETHLAAEDGHAPTGTTSRATSSRSASTSTGRPCSLASRRAGGLPLKTERNGVSSQLGYRWRRWKRNPSPNKRGRNGLSLSTGLCQATSTGQYPELNRRLVRMPLSGRNESCGLTARSRAAKTVSPRRPRSAPVCPVCGHRPPGRGSRPSGAAVGRQGAAAGRQGAALGLKVRGARASSDRCGQITRE